MLFWGLGVTRPDSSHITCTYNQGLPAPTRPANPSKRRLLMSQSARGGRLRHAGQCDRTRCKLDSGEGDERGRAFAGRRLEA
jgi:hypothetical protein